MMTPVRPLLVRTLLLAALVGGSGCALTRVDRDAFSPSERDAVERAEAADVLQAHLLGGDVVVFSAWQVTPTDVGGLGQRYDPLRRPTASGTLVVPLDSVAVFVADRKTPAVGAIAALTIMTGASAALTVYCLANTKSCFGSCPTFYAPDAPGDGSPRLVAEGYSASVMPGLAARDVDALAWTRAEPGPFELRMTNEALETHVTRRADVLAVPRAAGARVVFSGRAGADAGHFWTATAEAAPTACTGPEGDCLDRLARADGAERTSPADSTDLAARETLHLTFPAGAEGRRGLVLTGRQSLLTTFLVYQGLAYAGEDIGAWVAQAETRIRNGTPPGEGPLDLVSPIRVDARGAGGAWVEAGVVDEVGPLASDAHLVVLPDLPAGSVDVRLTLTQGAWRLDAARLVALGPQVVPVRVAPRSVLREHPDGVPTPDADALADLTDLSRSLVTLPGTALRLGYTLPDLPAGADAWELFLETEGYYLEWMRDEWMAERDPDALAELLLRPAAALRRLAPAFKAIEAGMDRVFWNSRFAAPKAAPIVLQ